LTEDFRNPAFCSLFWLVGELIEAIPALKGLVAMPVRWLATKD